MPVALARAGSLRRALFAAVPAPDDAGKPIGSGGLGETRGVVALKDGGSSDGSVDDSRGGARPIAVA